MKRRRFVELLAAYAAVPVIGEEESPQLITRAIPSSGERLPVIGMGTWITFDVGRSQSARSRLLPVLQTFFDRGGKLVDSSPMYGSSESVVGALLAQVKPKPALFAASKVWIPGRRLGPAQMEDSRNLWGIAS